MQQTRCKIQDSISSQNIGEKIQLYYTNQQYIGGNQEALLKAYILCIAETWTVGKRQIAAFETVEETVLLTKRYTKSCSRHERETKWNT